MIAHALLAALALTAANAAAGDAPAQAAHAAKKKAKPEAKPEAEAKRPSQEPFPEPPEASAQQPLDVTADHLTVKPKENVGVWSGHVHAVRAPDHGQPAVHIKCEELTTTYRGQKEGEQKVDKVTCRGNVEVVQGDRAGWGDLAVFDNESGILVVTGSPRAQQGPNRFSGDKVTFDVNANQLDVTGHVKTIMDAAHASGLPGVEDKGPSAKNEKKEPTP
jgi:lipopolysaccharide transport protein LptA